jgi:hypothetical protein
MARYIFFIVSVRHPFTTAIAPGRLSNSGVVVSGKVLVHKNEEDCKKRGSVEDAVELDGDHAFGDCGSRRPVKATSKNPCHMRGNSSTEAGRGTSGCYVERPARMDSTSLADALASRAGVRTTRPSWTLPLLLGRG